MATTLTDVGLQVSGFFLSYNTSDFQKFISDLARRFAIMRLYSFPSRRNSAKYRIGTWMRRWLDCSLRRIGWSRHCLRNRFVLLIIWDKGEQSWFFIFMHNFAWIFP